MKQLQFRLAARTDAAGKYNAEAPLEGNEDNMYVDSDLSNNAQGEFTADQVVNLSELGCLMVVADGMGGMNAGEVASEIAIKTVTEYFSPERLAGKTFRDSRARCKYLEEVVEAADANIKNDARRDKEHEGMGSTIIMGWLCDGEISLTWCGDSRAYLYRPGRGFWQVSKDHSYVQGLVDDGKITIDEAFDHPYGNIITRSLGDPEKKAKADSKVFPVFEGDIFMLCSDGLSGVLRDHKTYVDGQRIETENLEDIIDANRHSMAECRDALFAAAERNDWYDNVTAIVCEIVSGEPLPANLNEPPVSYPTPKTANAEPLPPSGDEMSNTSAPMRKKSLPIIIAAAVLLLSAIVFLVWRLIYGGGPSNDQEYFAFCKDNPTIENYRAYVKKYPDGEFVQLAKNWITDWEADSAAASKNLVRQNPTREDLNAEPKPEDKGKKEEKKAEKKEKGQDRNESSMDGTGESNSSNIPNLKDSKEDLKDSKEDLKDSNGDLKDSNGDNKSLKERLTPVTPEGGKTNLSPTQSASAKNEEEAYNRCLKSNSYEACADYLDKWGDKDKRNAGNFQAVQQLFTRLYKAKAKSCSTKEECEKFLKEHDGIMKKARMLQSGTDTQTRKIVNDKLNELKKANGEQASQSNTSGRPTTADKPNSKPSHPALSKVNPSKK